MDEKNRSPTYELPMNYIIIKSVVRNESTLTQLYLIGFISSATNFKCYKPNFLSFKCLLVRNNRMLYVFKMDYVKFVKKVISYNTFL